MSIALRTVIGTLLLTSLLSSITACSTVGRSSEELKAVFALRAEAEVLYQQGDYRAALAAYQTLSQQVPEHTHTWFRLGNCQAQLGNYSAATEAYQSALTLDPQYSRAWLNLAYVQAQQLAATAIAMYQTVPAGDPQSQRIYTLVEGVLAPFGDTLDSLPDLQEDAEQEQAVPAEPRIPDEEAAAEVTAVQADDESAE